jgi:uncharacterized membrane protein
MNEGFETSDDRDRRFESTLGRVLGLGILTSSMCLAAGLVLALTGAAGELSRPLLTTGLVLLMATPAARVFVSVLTYLYRRDWLFGVLTMVVFLELVASVIAAFR